MKKPKWRKCKSGWKRGVLEVLPIGNSEWVSYGDERWVGYYTTPEAAMKAADKWWERTRKEMEGK